MVRFPLALVFSRGRSDSATMINALGCALNFWGGGEEGMYAFGLLAVCGEEGEDKDSGKKDTFASNRSGNQATECVGCEKHAFTCPRVCAHE